MAGDNVLGTGLASMQGTRVSITAAALAILVVPTTSTFRIRSRAASDVPTPLIVLVQAYRSDNVE